MICRSWASWSTSQSWSTIRTIDSRGIGTPALMKLVEAPAADILHLDEGDPIDDLGVVHRHGVMGVRETRAMIRASRSGTGSGGRNPSRCRR